MKTATKQDDGTYDRFDEHLERGDRVLREATFGDMREYTFLEVTDDGWVRFEDRFGNDGVMFASIWQQQWEDGVLLIPDGKPDIDDPADENEDEDGMKIFHLPDDDVEANPFELEAPESGRLSSPMYVPMHTVDSKSEDSLALQMHLEVIYNRAQEPSNELTENAQRFEDAMQEFEEVFGEEPPNFGLALLWATVSVNWDVDDVPDL